MCSILCAAECSAMKRQTNYYDYKQAIICMAQHRGALWGWATIDRYLSDCDLRDLTVDIQLLIGSDSRHKGPKVSPKLHHSIRYGRYDSKNQ